MQKKHAPIKANYHLSKKKKNLTEIAIHAGVDAKTCFLKMENLIKIVCVLLFLVLLFNLR